MIFFTLTVVSCCVATCCVVQCLLGSGLRDRYVCLNFWSYLKLLARATLLSSGLIATGLVHAGLGSDPIASATSPTSKPQDTFGRDTPRGSVQGFLQALAKNDATLARRYLDLPKGKNNETSVDNLKAALDSGGRIASELQISNQTSGDLDDKLNANLDKVGEVDTADGSVDILLEKVKQSDGAEVWLISQKTLQKLNVTPANARPTLVEQYLPASWLTYEYKGYNLGHIAAVGLLLLVTYLVALLVSWLVYHLTLGLYQLTHRDRSRSLPIDSRVVVPLAAVITGLVIKELMLVVGINLVIRNFVERLADIFSWVALAWLLLRIVDIIFKRAESHASANKRVERVSVFNLLRKVIKLLLLGIAGIVILGNFGFDLTTGIAALGIGGLALALGAQKTIENLVGSVSLVADQPVNVGDYCRFGTQEGTIEDIGIRSTRIRTLDRTVVTIPNGNFSSMSIENFSERDMFHFSQVFYVARDSDTKQVRAFIEAVQIYITNHPATNSIWNEVKIVSTQQDAYVIEVKCYLSTSGAMEFNQKQTEMILHIADIMAESGLKNALPSRQITVETPMVTNDSKTTEAEGKPNLSKSG